MGLAIEMRLHNKVHNWLNGVKRYRGKGCRNVGTMRRGQETAYVKYDWDKPFVYQSPMYEYRVTALNENGETVMWDRWEVEK